MRWRLLLWRRYLGFRGCSMSCLVPAIDRLNRELFGIHFPNPIGLAAGFDKNGMALPAWEALGFGFIEIGTITAQGQAGNPRPRIFRIPEMEALINRLGFNNEGVEKIAGASRTTPACHQVGQKFRSASILESPRSSRWKKLRQIIFDPFSVCRGWAIISSSM